MKKLLALVLAMVMTLGLATVGASAAAPSYADAKDINYTEAVDVMSTIGVLGGDENGFRPADNLKRSEGAKIIAYLMLGANAAEQIKGGTKYSDVPASHWAAGYIEYLTVEGVVGGVGGGKFDPDGTLTVAAFTKMLIGALGYDAEVEGLGGPDWQINVQRLAKQIDLFDGNKSVVVSADIKREEAALYAFNMIQSPLVEYSNIGKVTAGDATVTFGSGKADYRVNTGKSLNRYNNISNKTTNNGNVSSQIIEFAEEYFEKLVKTEGADDFGRKSTTWTFDGKKIDEYTTSQDLLYTDTVTLGQIYKDLALTKGTYLTKDGNDTPAYRWIATSTGVVTSAPDGTAPNTYLNENVNYFIDGLAYDANVYGVPKLESDSNVKIGGPGTETYVFYDEGIVRITELNWYAGEVTGVYAATASKAAYIDVTNSGVDMGLDATHNILNMSGTKETTGFQVGDIVAYTAAFDQDTTGVLGVADLSNAKNGEANVKTVEKAEVVEGELNGFIARGVTGIDNQRSTGSVTIGGKKYAYGTKVANTPDGTFLKNGTKLSITLDKYGNAIDVGDYGVQNYAVVVKWGVAGSFGSDAVANLLLTDGTTTGAVTLNDDYVTPNAAANTITYKGTTYAMKTGDIVTYTIGSNGNYALTLKSRAYNYTNANEQDVVTNGSASLNGEFVTSRIAGPATGPNSALRTANGKTVFLIKDNSGNYKAYTGIKDVPTIYSDGSGTPFIINSFAAPAENGKAADAAAKVVYVDISDGFAGLRTNETIFVHVDKTVGRSVNSSGDVYYEFEAIVNGEKKTIKVDEQDGLDLKDEFANVDHGYALFTSMTTNSKDIATLGGRIYAQFKSTAEKNGAIGLGNSTYTYSSNVKVFYINENNEITTSSIKGIPTSDTTMVWFNIDSSSEVNYVFWRKGIVKELDALDLATNYTAAQRTAMIEAALDNTGAAHIIGTTAITLGTGFNVPAGTSVIFDGTVNTDASHSVTDGTSSVYDMYIEGYMYVGGTTNVNGYSRVGRFGNLESVGAINTFGSGHLCVEDGGQVIQTGANITSTIAGASLEILGGIIRFASKLNITGRWTMIGGNFRATDKITINNAGAQVQLSGGNINLDDLEIAAGSTNVTFDGANVTTDGLTVAGTGTLTITAGNVKTGNVALDGTINISSATKGDTSVDFGEITSPTGTGVLTADANTELAYESKTGVSGTISADVEITGTATANYNGLDLPLAWTESNEGASKADAQAMILAAKPAVTLSNTTSVDASKITLSNAEAYVTGGNKTYMVSGDTVKFVIEIDDANAPTVAESYTFDNVTGGTMTVTNVTKDGDKKTLSVTYKAQ